MGYLLMTLSYKNLDQSINNQIKIWKSVENQYFNPVLIDWMKPKARMLLVKRLLEVFPKIKFSEMSRIINREHRQTNFNYNRWKRNGIYDILEAEMNIFETEEEFMKLCV